MSHRILRALLVGVLLLLIAAPGAAAMPDADGGRGGRGGAAKTDYRPHPLRIKQTALKQTALEKKLKEKVTGKPDHSVVEMGEGQFAISVMLAAISL